MELSNVSPRGYALPKLSVARREHPKEKRGHHRSKGFYAISMLAGKASFVFIEATHLVQRRTSKAMKRR